MNEFDLTESILYKDLYYFFYFVEMTPLIPTHRVETCQF